MNRLIAITCGLLMVMFSSTSAFASSFFLFTYGDSTIAASGNLTANDLGSGTFLITAVTGNVNGISISGLLPLGSLGSDDILSGAGPMPDLAGFTFGLSNSGEVNLYSVNGQAASFVELPGKSPTSATGTFSITQTLAPTPEPSSIALFGSGMLGLAGIVRRRLAI